MSRSRRFGVFVPVVSIFAALSLAAMAEEPPKKPPSKMPTVQQKGPAGPGPQVGHGPRPWPLDRSRPLRLGARELASVWVSLWTLRLLVVGRRLLVFL